VIAGERPASIRFFGVVGSNMNAVGQQPLGMDDQHLFDELVRVAETLGVAVRMEAFETPATAGGGSCIFRGERLILLDAQAPLRGRIMALARALSELENETVFMVPEAREVVEAVKGARSRGSNVAESSSTTIP